MNYFEFLFQLFDERPVWTKAGLAFFAQNIENSAMKFILAASAYYFTTGPWRNAWVRFGYDPREDVNARFLLFFQFYFENDLINCLLITLLVSNRLIMLFDNCLLIIVVKIDLIL